MQADHNSVVSSLLLLGGASCLVESMKMEKERSKKRPQERKARRSHGRERLCEWTAPSCLKKHRSV
jgi:hypothetical protein